jgi:peroxiredoxin 2/4
MLTIGQPIPSFAGLAYQEGGFVAIDSQSLLGRWVVLFFYPGDFTHICPSELRGFQDELDRFRSQDTRVLACSTDSVYCHRAWIERDLRGITYPILSDPTHLTCEAFEVLDEQTGQANRGTFIIDPEGVLRYQVISDKNVGRSVHETLRVLEALQTGSMCPAEWQAGDETIAPG